jgi:hypothetical protein
MFLPLLLLLQVVGIDKSPSQAAKAAARHQGSPNLSFAQVDGYDLAAVRRLADEHSIGKFTVIFIDVSGRCGAEGFREVNCSCTVSEVLQQAVTVLRPRRFVTKRSL